MKGGYRTRLHNDIRDTVHALAREARLLSRVEHQAFHDQDRGVQDLTADQHQVVQVRDRNRLDVFVTGAGDRGRMATDISYINPYTDAGAQAHLEAMAQVKTDYYGARCIAAGISFHPGIVNFFGCMHKGLHTFLSELARKMSLHGVCDQRAAIAICFGRVSVQVAKCTGDLLTLNIPKPQVQ
jgi:hypothetical protein